MGRKTRRESLTRPSVLRTLGREPGSPRLTRYARYAFGAPPGGTEGEGEERRRESKRRGDSMTGKVRFIPVSHPFPTPSGFLHSCLTSGSPLITEPEGCSGNEVKGETNEGCRNPVHER